VRGYRSFTDSPHPGDLRNRVEIGFTKNEKNQNGYPEPVDTVICAVWAAAEGSGSQDFRAADAKYIEQETNFIIRYRKDIKKGMWVRFKGEKGDKGEKWFITAIDPYGFTRQYLGLKASDVEGVAG